jgi:hypothetical protein
MDRPHHDRHLWLMAVQRHARGTPASAQFCLCSQGYAPPLAFCPSHEPLPRALAGNQAPSKSERRFYDNRKDKATRCPGEHPRR